MKLVKKKLGWYAVVRTETGQQAIRLHTNDKTEAARLAQEAKIAELETAAKVRALTAETVMRITAGGRVTCTEALDRWLVWAKRVNLSPNTRERYSTYVRRFLREHRLASRPPTAITFDALDAFVNPTEPIKAATRANRLSALQSWFLVLAADGLVLGNPAAKLRVRLHGLSHSQKEPAVREPFTASELAKLSQLESPFWRAATAIALHTGLRLGDICQLEWDCFSRPGRMIVWTDKRDVRVEFATPPAVERAMTGIPKTDPRWVFPEERAMILDPRRRNYLSVYFAREMDRLGISKSFHCLRHTFASLMARTEGETVDTIRRRMGHAHTATTEGYIHS